MALDIINPVQNTSYVNRDFESVYSELLDLVKKLTYKWDPSISNESDPGVILLKLNAIIADKLSYNLDKNILECFPLSVTQEGNARQLFEQLGYYMKWYRGATTNVAIKWKAKTTSGFYTIPAFTMVTDADSNIVYSLIGPNISSSQLVVSDQSLSLDGSILVFKAIQGIPVKYDINGETLIRFSSLDSNRRLYFNSSDVAQNGVFITNRGMNNFSSWTRVDNLTVQAVSDNDRFFKFGVTTDGTTCYLEFPDNAEALFGEGIEITYIRTLGEDGNVSPRMIEKFYQDLVPAEDNTIILNADNVIISNISSAANGANPETINEAYRGYKRTIGTFDTLVTLRDYFNYIVSAEGLVSNAIVTDRTNDIQSTYKIVSQKSLIDNVYTQIEENSSNEPVLTAYSLKLYLLKYKSSIDNADSYNASFTMMNNAEKGVVENFMQDSKSIQHDYEKLISGKVTYFVNKYPINCSVTTQHALTTTEANDVTNNIKLAIYKQLNSQQVDFGEDVPIDLIRDVIISADKRIKDVTFSTAEQTTYAFIYQESDPLRGNGTFVSIPINGSEYDALGTDDKSLADSIREDVYAKCVLAGVTQLYVKDEPFDYQLGQRYSSLVSNVEKIVSGVDVPVEDNVSGNVWEYLIRPNETIQFFAPNLIDSTSYSNFVKFECVVGQDIEKNTSYQLKSTDCIVFYWKSDSDSVYKYTTYAEGCIIKPSFTIHASDDSEASVPVLGTHQAELWPERNTTNYNIINGGYVRSSDEFGNMTEDTSKLVAEKLIGNNYVLSGTKKVTIQTANKLELKNNEEDSTNYYCYWILNSTTNGRYVLFESANTNADLEYILDTGEYFFYTNAQLTQLVVLGAGTKITKKTTGEMRTWSVPILDSSEIMQDGISAFSPNDWYQLDNNETCELVENQYYNFGSGVTVRMTAKDSNAEWPEYISKESVDVSDFIVEYIPQGSTRPVSLPDMVLDNIGGWMVRSLLNLSISPTQEQFVLGGILHNQSQEGDGQYVTYWVEGSDTAVTIRGQNLATQQDTGDIYFNYYPVALRASRNVNISGAEVSTQTVQGIDGDEYLTLYQYARMNSIRDEDADVDLVKYGDDGKAIVYCAPGDSLINVPISFPPNGNYILPVFIPSNTSVTTVWVSNGDGSSVSRRLKEINSTNWNIATPGVHYLVGNINQNIMQVNIEGNTEEFNLQILNLYRYVRPDGMSSSEFDDIQDLIGELDVQRLFNYTYQVDEDILIDNPLDAVSFLDPYHPFNKFTICQFDTSPKTVIKILNKR